MSEKASSGKKKIKNRNGQQILKIIKIVLLFIPIFSLPISKIIHFKNL